MQLVHYIYLFAFLGFFTLSVGFLPHLFRISKHRFPKIVGGILLILFACVAFIFGIHSDIFSSYDKFNTKQSDTYNWFNPVHAFNFPIDQVEINRKIKYDLPLKSSIVNLSKIYAENQLPTIKYTIVIDKTPSTKKGENSDLDETRERLKEELRTSIGNNSYDYSGFELEDLILLSGLNQIRTLNGKSKNLFEVRYYYGDKDFDSPLEIDPEISVENILTVANFIKNTVIPKVAKGKSEKPNVKTDIASLVKTLCSENCIGDNSAFNNLFIISDFEHEPTSGSSFNSLRESLQNLSLLKIRQINLIKVKGINNNSDLVSNTLNLFRETFSDLFYYEFEESFKQRGKYEIGEVNSEVTNIFASAIENDSIPQALLLYNSWDNSSYKYDYVGSLQFSCDNPYLGLGNSDEQFNFGERNAIMRFPNLKYRIHSGGLNLIPIEKDKYEIVKLSTFKSDSKNYYLEIREPKSIVKTRINIVLRQVLPTTSSIYLIMLYFSFMVGIISLIGYYLTWLYKSDDVKFTVFKFTISKNHRIYFSAFTFSVSLILILLNLSPIGYILGLKEIFFFTVLILFFYVLLFRHSYIHAQMKATKKAARDLAETKKTTDSVENLQGITLSLEDLKQKIVTRNNEDSIPKDDLPF